MCPCGACATWTASILSLVSSLFHVEGLEIRNQVGDVFRAQSVGLRVRHGAQGTRKSVLDDLRNVGRRRRQPIQQLRMRGVVEQVAKSRANLALVKRRGVVADAALLSEQRLSG